MDIEEMWDVLVDYGIATDDEVALVTYINGANEKSMKDILYVRTGYRDFDQYLEEFQLDDSWNE